jgi:uncharacterized membrane protein YfcA
MIAGTVGGMELGARIVERLEKFPAGTLEMVLNTIYLVLLLGISVFMLIESFRATRVADETISAHEASTLPSFTHRVQRIRIPPMIRLPSSGIESVSLWLILLVGFVTGLLAGVLGVGGGFFRMPALVYLLGIPTHVAVGTDLFEIVFSAGFGTVTHALKGNVDILMALVMQTGAAVGAQVGAQATRYVSGPRLRLAFALLPLIGAILLIANVTAGGPLH